MRDEAVGELRLPVKQAQHLAFPNHEHGGGCNRGRRGHANGLASQAAFSEKVTRSQYGHDRFFTGFIDDGELHTALLNIKDIPRSVALREDALLVSKPCYLSSDTCRIEKSLHVERRTPESRLLGPASGAGRDTWNGSGQHTAE